MGGLSNGDSSGYNNQRPQASVDVGPLAHSLTTDGVSCLSLPTGQQPAANAQHNKITKAGIIIIIMMMIIIITIPGTQMRNSIPENRGG